MKEFEGQLINPCKVTNIIQNEITLLLKKMFNLLYNILKKKYSNFYINMRIKVRDTIRKELNIKDNMNITINSVKVVGDLATIDHVGNTKEIEKILKNIPDYINIIGPSDISHSYSDIFIIKLLVFEPTHTLWYGDKEQLIKNNILHMNNDKYWLISTVISRKRASVDAEIYSVVDNLKYKSIPPFEYPFLSERKMTSLYDVSKLNIFIIKCIPLEEIERKNMYNIKYKSWRELYFMELFSDIVLENKCPNFTLIYFHYVVDDMKEKYYLTGRIKRLFNDKPKRDRLRIKIKKYENKIKSTSLLKKGELTRKLSLMKTSYRRMKYHDKNYGLSSLYLALEPSYNIDLVSFLEKLDIIQKYEKDSTFNVGTILLSIIFQLLYAINVMHHNKVIHLDLHAGNILIDVKFPGNYWKYEWKDTIYYVPNGGILAKITDFGRSEYRNSKYLFPEMIRQLARFFKGYKNKNKVLKYLHKNNNKKNTCILMIIGEYFI